MSIPAVSVVMPVHNAGRFLDSAICSIRLQTLTDLELIIVDDGSTDSSPEVLREHAAADPRLSVLRRPHGGVAIALNRGLVAARAELVARMDADDEAKPDRLERQLAALEAQPDTAVLGTGCEIIDSDGRVIRTAVPKADPVELRQDLLKANCLIHPTITMRRRLVLAIGGYRPVFTAAEDYDLWLRLSERHDLSNLPDLLLRYRVHGGRATARRWRLQLLEVLAAQHAAHLRRAGRPDPMRGFSRIDAAALEAIGVPRRAIRAALKGRDVMAPPLPQPRLSGLLSSARRYIVPKYP